ncbi:hypothetical protein GCM10027443_33200 [Pontibacter brevis]
MLLFSCSREERDLEQVLIKDAYKNSVFQNEIILSEVINELGTGRLGRADSLLKADMERIASWRRNFVRKPTLESLLLYADSIEHQSNKPYENPHELSVPLRKLREQVASSPDSAAFYGLLYCATAIEGSELQRKSVERGTFCKFGPSFPSYLDKSQYQLGDTVFLTVNITDVYTGDSVFDFSHVACRNTESGVTFKPKVIRTGPYYILMFTPGSYGEYEIVGGFTNKQDDNFGYAIRVQNSFAVKPAVLEES